MYHYFQGTKIKKFIQNLGKLNNEINIGKLSIIYQKLNILPMLKQYIFFKTQWSKQNFGQRRNDFIFNSNLSNFAKVKILEEIDNYTSRQWCSKTTKLQDQDHLFFQDHFFKIKTKIAFFKDHQIINPRSLA